MITRLPLDREKLVAATLYIASRVGDPTKWRIGKMLFLGDYAHLARYGRPIVGGRYCAMPNGPVPSEALDFLNGILSQDIGPEFWGMGVEVAFDVQTGPYPLFKPRTEPNLSVLSESDVEILDTVIGQFGKESFGDLSDFVHKLPAYKRAIERDPDSKNPAIDYEDFFEDNPFGIPGTKQEFMEDYELSRAFPHVAV